MGFVSNDKTSRDYVNNFYDPYDRLPYNHQGKGSRTWRTFTAQSEYRASFGKLMAGVDYLEWDSAKHNYHPWMDSMMRLQIPAPTPFFGFELNADPVTYTQYSDKLYYDKHKDKYFHAHRLDLHLPAQITFGIGETIVYGSTVEAAGTNPNRDARQLRPPFRMGLGHVLRALCIRPALPRRPRQHGAFLRHQRQDTPSLGILRGNALGRHEKGDIHVR